MFTRKTQQLVFKVSEQKDWIISANEGQKLLERLEDENRNEVWPEPEKDNTGVNSNQVGENILNKGEAREADDDKHFCGNDDNHESNQVLIGHSATVEEPVLRKRMTGRSEKDDMEGLETVSVHDDIVSYQQSSEKIDADDKEPLLEVREAGFLFCSFCEVCISFCQGSPCVKVSRYLPGSKTAQGFGEEHESAPVVIQYPSMACESYMAIFIQIVFPVMIAGLGTVMAGCLLDKVQSWDVFIVISELFILVPALSGLKGNLEMTLASRLSTAVRFIFQPIAVNPLKPSTF